MGLIATWKQAVCIFERPRFGEIGVGENRVGIQRNPTLNATTKFQAHLVSGFAKNVPDGRIG